MPQGLMNRLQCYFFVIRCFYGCLRCYALWSRSVELRFHVIISGRSAGWIDRVKLLWVCHYARHHAVFLQGVHLIQYSILRLLILIKLQFWIDHHLIDKGPYSVPVVFTQLFVSFCQQGINKLGKRSEGYLHFIFSVSLSCFLSLRQTEFWSSSLLSYSWILNIFI